MTLAYHSVGECPVKETGAGLYCVSTDNFKDQMSYLNKGTVLFGDSPFITFDDGDITNYTNAYPILKKMGLKAYFFIIGGRVGTPGYMNWSKIKELHDAGMIIGSHGMTHRILAGLSDDELDYEFIESKKIIEDNLKTSIDSVSIPRGFCSKKIINKAADAGYKTIFTSDNRIAVKPGWGMDHFIKVINNGYLLQDKVEDIVKNAFKKIFGVKNYDKIRTRVLR